MFTVGEKWTFEGDELVYDVKAANESFAILTAPAPEHDTVWYTIVDLQQKVRGTNNMVFNPYDYAVQKDIDRCMQDLDEGTVEVTHRNRVPLGTFQRVL